MVNMRVKILAAFGGLVLFFVFIFAAGHSSLDITVQNPSGNTPITYTIIDKKGKAQVTTTSRPVLSKFLAAGAYQVGVSQGSTTYTAFVQAKSFLRKTSLTVSLRAESARTIVGVNPAFCTLYAGARLVSGDCSTPFEKFHVHEPATATSPQYTDTVPSLGIAGNYEGVVYTKLGRLILVQSTDPEEGQNGHFVSILRDDLGDTNPVKLAGLNPSQTYAIQPYKDGFIAFTTSGGGAFYVSSLSSLPVPIPQDKPTDSSLSLKLVGADATRVTRLYAPSGDAETAPDELHKNDQQLGNSDIPVARPSSIKNEVVLSVGSEQRHYSLRGIYTAAQPCGTDKVCLVNQGALEVYDASGKKLKHLYDYLGVQTIAMSGKGLLAITKSGVTLLDVDSGTGFVEYSFGQFSYSGINQTENGYILTVGDSKLGKLALLIDQNTIASDALDKKVAVLSQQPGVQAVSPYRNIIYVVPDYRSVGIVYNRAIRGYDYDPVGAKQVHNQVAAAIAKAGLNTSQYQVISTGQ